MNKEELVNLNMKDIILNKWKSKLSYPFRQTDLEELENIINYYEEENFNLREGIYIEKMSFPSEGRNFKELIEMPTYEELKRENEKLHHYKTLYQSLKKQKEELRSWLVEQEEKSWDEVSSTFGYVLDKLEELEGVSNE